MPVPLKMSGLPVWLALPSNTSSKISFLHAELTNTSLPSDMVKAHGDLPKGLDETRMDQPAWTPIVARWGCWLKNGSNKSGPKKPPCMADSTNPVDSALLRWEAHTSKLPCPDW